MSIEKADVVVIGSGFGGAIPAYYLAAGGADVVILERGPRLAATDFQHDLRVGSLARIVDVIRGEGMSVVAGNCVGGSSVVYFAASLRAPSFVFERKGSLNRRLWPAVLARSSLDPWYDRVEAALPVVRQTWNDVSYAGGLFAAACRHAGLTCNTVPVAVDLDRCTNCNWMLTGCRFDAKRSMLLNYLPAAEAYGARIRPLHEVQSIAPASTSGYRYRVKYQVESAETGAIEAKVVIVAAGACGTPPILQRSAAALGGMPHAVGRYFSGNGDRVSVAVLDEARVRSVLGLSRDDQTAYAAFPIGKPINTMTYDHLDPASAEFTRFSLQQIYFPSVTNVLAQAPAWFGVAKREARARWRSWLAVLAMTEDDNEGVFGAPPPTGGFVRLAPGLGLGPLRFRATHNTRRGWELSDAAVRSLIEPAELGSVQPWAEDLSGAITAHPLGSCRMGDDPQISALDDQMELRGHAGIFVTDGAAVPTSLTVNPALTIAALAERSVPGIVRSAAAFGVPVTYGAPVPIAIRA